MALLSQAKGFILSSVLWKGIGKAGDIKARCHLITAKLRRAGKSVGVVDVDVVNDQKVLPLAPLPSS